MIIDVEGKPFPPAKKPIFECPKCKAGKKFIRPVLGGEKVCMKCGYQAKDEQWPKD